MKWIRESIGKQVGMAEVWIWGEAGVTGNENKDRGILQRPRQRNMDFVLQETEQVTECQALTYKFQM